MRFLYNTPHGTQTVWPLPSPQYTRRSYTKNLYYNVFTLLLLLSLFFLFDHSCTLLTQSHRFLFLFFLSPPSNIILSTSRLLRFYGSRVKLKSAIVMVNPFIFLSLLQSEINGYHSSPFLTPLCFTSAESTIFNSTFFFYPFTEFTHWVTELNSPIQELTPKLKLHRIIRWKPTLINLTKPSKKNRQIKR